MFVHGPSQDGEGYQVIRKREDALEFGELRAVQEGRPIQGEMVKLKPRTENDRLFDVEVMVSREELSAGTNRSGPAQVATDRYRSNWDAIFGKSEKPDLLN